MTRAATKPCGRLGGRRALLGIRAEEGWGLVETLVAALMLTVGLLATFVMLDATVEASYITRAREGAVTLSRQLTDDARSIPFSQLSNGTIQAELQALPGLANDSPGSDWEIVRRGVTYTVTTTVTSYNDTDDPTASGQLAVREVTATSPSMASTRICTPEARRRRRSRSTGRPTRSAT